MAAEDRTASTRNARTVDQRGAGTGQHAPKTDVGEGMKIPRFTDSPMKSAGGEPKFSDVRRNERDTPGNGLTPPAMERNARFLKDTGTKTGRESEFNTAMKERAAALDGTGGTPRTFYPTAYESQKAKVATADKNAGSETGYRAKKAQ